MCCLLQLHGVASLRRRQQPNPAAVRVSHHRVPLDTGACFLTPRGGQRSWQALTLCPALRSPCLSRHQARRCWSSLCLLPRAWAASSSVSTTSPTHVSACRRVCTVPALPASACARLATTALLATSGGATGGRCWWKILEVSAPMATWLRSANCSPSRNSAGGSFSQRRSLATVRAAFTSSCSSVVCPTI